jgi:uncharacterized membrane protein YkvI
MKITSQRYQNVFLGFAYIGAVIGAGFASGQEILQFFSLFGSKGTWGVVLASLLFMLFGGVILDLGRRSKAESYSQVVTTAGGTVFGGLLDLLITAYLLGCLVVMAAGAGAVTSEVLGTPPNIGSIGLIILSILTVALGLNAVIAALGLIAPVMIATVLTIAISTIVSDKAWVEPFANNSSPPIQHWILSALLYVSYNMLGAISVLAPMGSRLRSSHDSISVGTVGAMGLGIGAMAAHLAVLSTPASAGSSVPLVALAHGIHPVLGRIYAFILLLEVYTTAIACLYGITARLRGGKGSAVYWIVLIAASIFSWLMSQLGLARAVRTIYPLMGWAGLLLLLFLTFTAFSSFIKSLIRRAG